MITINPQAADVITIQISEADQITLNTTAIVLLGGGGSSGGDADTLQGENGAYYLSRANHTGTQEISTVDGLQTALDTLTDTDEDLQAQVNLKLDSADYNDRFLGLYASFFDLEAAHPTANAGDYAQVDLGIGSDVIVYAWDVSDEYWAAVGSSPIANTDALPEGSSNLYFTAQRVRDTPLTGLSTASATPITAADSVLSAAGKLQAQISAAGSGGVARRMPAGFWQTATGVFANSTTTFNSGVVQYVYFYVPQTITVSQVSLSAVATQAAGEFKLRFYDLANNAAVSPEYIIPAAGSGLITYTLPSPLTIPAGNYFFGLLSNTAATRQILGVSAPAAIAFPSADGVLSINRTEGRLYSAGLPATATLGVSASGNQANINFLVTA